MNRFARHLTLVLAAPLLFAVTACTEGTGPTAIDSLAVGEAVLSASTTEADLARLARFESRGAVPARVGHLKIGPAGGRFEFHGFAVDVPAGALDQEVQFSIRLPADPHGKGHVVAAFGPHNTTFAQPITLEFPLAGTTIAGSEGASVVYWNGTVWEEMGGTPTADGARLLTTTNHFSTYGTAEMETENGRGGVLTASGG
jgi:hypothetical protein